LAFHAGVGYAVVGTEDDVAYGSHLRVERMLLGVEPPIHVRVARFTVRS
jgi:hypothetical protein